MSEKASSKLRICADFNSCIEDERGRWCWLLRHDGKILDEVAGSLGVYEGMPVIIYYEDDCEEFECDAILGHITKPGWTDTWMALFDEKSFRQLR